MCVCGCVCVDVCVCGCVCVHAQLCMTSRPYKLWPARLLCPWDFPANNTGVGCPFLLQVRMCGGGFIAFQTAGGGTLAGSVPKMAACSLSFTLSPPPPWSPCLLGVLTALALPPLPASPQVVFWPASALSFVLGSCLSIRSQPLSCPLSPPRGNKI